MTKADATWLIEEFKPKKDGIVSGKTIGMFTKAISIMANQPERKCPDCSCQYLVEAKIANSMFSQHEAEIEKLYASKRRGRKKKV